MQRMRHAQLMDGARQRLQDLAGRGAVIGVFFVQIQIALVELEGTDATGVDHFDGKGLGRGNGVGDIVVDLFLALARGEHAQKEIVAAEHHIGALVDNRRIAEFHVRLAGVGRQHRRFEAGGVAHLGIAVARRQSRRRGVADTGSRARGAGHRMGPVVLRQQGAGDINLAAADVGVRVDGAGHDHLTAQIDLGGDRFR